MAILPIVTREEIKMMYIYDPEKLDELLETVKDDDSITITGRQLRELADTICGLCGKLSGADEKTVEEIRALAEQIRDL